MIHAAFNEADKYPTRREQLFAFTGIDDPENEHMGLVAMSIAKLEGANPLFAGVVASILSAILFGSILGAMHERRKSQ